MTGGEMEGREGQGNSRGESDLPSLSRRSLSQ